MSFQGFEVPERCGQGRHFWREQIREGAVGTHGCGLCPACGVACPGCSSGSVRRCMRCGGSGVVEIVEASAIEIHLLRRKAARGEWMLRQMAFTTGDKAELLAAEADELIAAGIDETDIAALLAGKKPPAARECRGLRRDHRPRL